MAICFQWSNDSQMAVAGCEDGRAELFYAKKKFSSKPLITRGEPIRALQFSPNNERLLIGSGAKILIWDVKSGSKRLLEKSTFPSLEASIYDIQWWDENTFTHHSKDRDLENNYALIFHN